jgi:hypothetical protein
MRKPVLALIALCAAGPVLADPLVDALNHNDGILCFTRAYDSTWLKSHPGQTLRGVTFAITDDGRDEMLNMRLALDLPRGPLYGFGQCWWETNINRGVQNDILDPTFTPTEGVYCHMMTDITGGSAEEGAEFSVDWRNGGQTIQAHLPEAMAMWSSYDIGGTADWHDLKQADRIVRLNRVEQSECDALIAQFAPNGLE